MPQSCHIFLCCFKCDKVVPQWICSAALQKLLPHTACLYYEFLTAIFPTMHLMCLLRMKKGKGEETEIVIFIRTETLRSLGQRPSHLLIYRNGEISKLQIGENDGCWSAYFSHVKDTFDCHSLTNYTQADGQWEISLPAWQHLWQHKALPKRTNMCTTNFQENINIPRKWNRVLKEGNKQPHTW